MQSIENENSPADMEEDRLEGEGEGGSNASPEEQQMYDQFVGAALHQIWGDDMSHQAILKKIKDEGPDRIGFAIGHTAAMLCRSIVGGLRKAGRDLPEDILFAGAQEIVENLVEMASAAGIIPKGGEQQVMEAALLEGTKAYADAEVAEGNVTPDRSAMAATELSELSAQARAMAPKQQGGIVSKAKEG